MLHTRSSKAHAKSRSRSSSQSTGDSTNLSLIAYGAWGDKKKQKQVARAAKRHIFDGADPNACDHNGFTALHWAAKYNWVQLIDVLVVRSVLLTLFISIVVALSTDYELLPLLRTALITRRSSN